MRNENGIGTYLRNERPRSNRSAPPDLSVSHDLRAVADIDVVFNDNRASDEVSLAALFLGRIARAVAADEAHAFADVHAVADDDLAGVFDVAVALDDDVVADFDVVAVVAFEGRFDHHAVADAAWSAEGGRHGGKAGAGVPFGFGAFGWVEDCGEEARSLFLTGCGCVEAGLVEAFDC